MIDLEAIKQRLAAAKGEHRHVFVAHAEEDVGVLVEEVERLRAENDAYRIREELRVLEIERGVRALEAENAAGKHALEAAAAELAKRNAKLAWFEDAWSWVKAAMLRVQELEEVRAFRHDEVLLKLVAPIIRKIETEHLKPGSTHE